MLNNYYNITNTVLVSVISKKSYSMVFKIKYDLPYLKTKLLI